jgi:hypothetical protein
MNPRMTLALLLLCVAVGAYLYWVPAPSSTDDAASATPKIAVTDFESQQVASFEATKDDGSVFRVNRDPNIGWMIEQPTKFPGDEVVIGPAIQAIAQLSATSVITPTTSDLSGYGLSTPSMTITLRDSAQATLVTLLVGGSNPTGDAQYVKRSDDARIYLVSDINLSIVGTWFTATPLKPTALPTYRPATETPTTTP